MERWKKATIKSQPSPQRKMNTQHKKTRNTSHNDERLTEVWPVSRDEQGEREVRWQKHGSPAGISDKEQEECHVVVGNQTWQDNGCPCIHSVSRRESTPCLLFFDTNMITKPTFQEHECPRRVWVTGLKTTTTDKQHTPYPTHIHVLDYLLHMNACVKSTRRTIIYFCRRLITKCSYPTRRPVTLLLLLAKHPLFSLKYPWQRMVPPLFTPIDCPYMYPCHHWGLFSEQLLSSECHWHNDALCFPLIGAKYAPSPLFSC